MGRQIPEDIDVALHQSQVDAHRVDVEQFAQGAGHDQIADLLHRRRVAVGVVAHQDQAPLGSEGDHLLALRRRGRQGLLDEDVLARLQHGRGDGPVGGGRGGDRHRFDRVVVEDVVDRRGHPHRAVAADGLGRPGLVEVAHPNQVGPGVAGEVADDVRAPVPGPDHRDPHRCRPVVAGRHDGGISDDLEHPLQGHPGPFGIDRVDLDLVHDVALDQVLQDPCQVGGVDAEHGRARADQGVERLDSELRVLGRQALHQVDLGAHADHRPGGGGVDSPDDEVGRSHLVGHVDHLGRALGVHDHDAFGVPGPEVRHVGDGEPLVDRAVALPQQERRFLDVGLHQAPEITTRVPHPHVVGTEPELAGGVAAQVLVGEEEQLVGPLQAPGHDRPGVGRGAHRPALAADEGLEGGRGVHVGDGQDALDVGRGGQLLPRHLHRVDVGHVGHGAAGVEVGEDDGLVVAGEHVGRFGHEVDAAEDDEFGRRVGRQPGQSVGVAAGVGPPHDLVPLVVVAEDEQPFAELGLGVADPLRELFLAGRCVAVGQRPLDPEHMGDLR